MEHGGEIGLICLWAPSQRLQHPHVGQAHAQARLATGRPSCLARRSHRFLLGLTDAGLADHPDRAGLRPLFSLFLHKAHLAPDPQAAKTAVQDALFVEIDLSPIPRSEKAISFPGQEFADAPD